VRVKQHDAKEENMKKQASKANLEDDLLPEYDFSKMKLVGRGIYTERFRSGTNLALLDRDVREAFPDDDSVNEALRVIAKAGLKQASRIRKRPVKNRRQTSQVR
jgi:hypothetical protein